MERLETSNLSPLPELRRFSEMTVCHKIIEQTVLLEQHGKRLPNANVAADTIGVTRGNATITSR